MIPTLAWKEYREQRGLWIALSCLAALVVFTGNLLGQVGINNDSILRQVLIAILFSLMVAQGVVCGAQLLAGENEPGTQAFLDAMSSRRFPLWWTKLIVGCLFTLAQALFLFGCILNLQLGLWDYLTSLVVVGLLALCFGIIGGALCEKVFSAILTGIALAAGNLWVFLMIPLGHLAFGREFAQILIALVALAISKKVYCAADKDRRLQHKILQTGFQERGPSSWQALFWLANKQGSRLIWFGMGMCFLVGIFSFENAKISWPIATLIIGLVCGLAVFTPEQSNEQDRFMGAQRFPPGYVWLIKTVFWALVAAGMAALLGGNMLLIREAWMRGPHLNERISFPDHSADLLWTLWVIHGFCFGQFFGLLSRRTVVTGFLSLGTSLFVLALWLPSLVNGGVRAWQILAVPLMLLVIVRLSMWTWFSGRLFTRRHTLGLMGSFMVVAAWIGGSFWYRAVEIPKVGKPFDLQAFDAKLNQAAQSEASTMIRQGMDAMNVQRRKVRAKMGPPTNLLFPLAPDNKNLPSYLEQGDYLAACAVVLEKGWPQEDGDFNRWLDAMFAGDWFDYLRQAGKLPLGLMWDPRQNHEISRGENDAIWKYQNLGPLLAVRALQLQTREDDRAALETIASLLDLSCQFRHCGSSFGSPFYHIGQSLEWYGLEGFDKLLVKIGPRPEFLRMALNLLQRNEKNLPLPQDAIKATYLVILNALNNGNLVKSGSTLDQFLYTYVLEFPWEKERIERLIAALYQGQLRLVERPPTQWNQSGLRFVDGGWTAEQWRRAWWESWFFQSPRAETYFPIQSNKLRARQIYVALMLYLVEEGHPPAQLVDLVPHFLSAVPLNAWLNQAFDYRISLGGEVSGRFPTDYKNRTEPIIPGQGLLSYPMEDLNNKNETDTYYFPVPLWTKNKE